MSETRQGKLRWSIGKDKARSWQVEWTSKRGKPQTSRPYDGTLAAELLITTANDIAIDYELSPDGSYPMNIRPAGKPWVEQPLPARQVAQPIGARAVPAAPRVGHFHNPYNFIPALEPQLDGPLGQHAPVGHKAWYAEYFSGRLTVDIEVVTPLIVPDASRAETLPNGHTIVPLLTENNDGETPKLPPTSFKGALRSAYEAITNSRLSVFQGHDAPLGRRMEAGEGLAMVPARISDDGNHLELYFGEFHPKTESEA